ncbi:unnamed protein product [Ectocarpus sp. CCAP 1310/34]|nr:unnamed protein product [Ectocarpus sp. CCAP 1310/34]
MREAAQKRQDVALATFGGMTAECVCLPIVDASGKLVKRNLLPELARLTVRQSVQVPVADSTNITFGGYSLHHNGLGVGSVYLSAQHDVTAEQWVGSLVQIGQQPKVGLSCGTASKGSSGVSVQSQCTYEPDGGLGLRVSTTERLDPVTVVDMSWEVVGGKEGGAADDAVTVHVTRLVGDGTGTLAGEVAIGHRSWMDLGLRLSYRHTIAPSRMIQLGGKIGVRGMEVELDSRRFLPRQVKLKTALRVGDGGVSAVFSLQRGAMVFELPVLLSSLLTGWTLTCGGLLPALVDAGVGWLLSSAWQRRAERLRSEGEPLRRRRLARDWGDAASQVRLMVHMADKRRHEEMEKGGLVILLARYGADLSRDCGERWWAQAPQNAAAGGGTAGTPAMPLSGLVESEGPEGAAAVELVSQPNVDVTVPLQFFVKDSTLTLPFGSKSHLLGFFTPAPCRLPRREPRYSDYREGARSQERDGWGGEGTGGWGSPLPAAAAQLRIRYLFAGRTFEETFRDCQEVVLPSPTSTYLGDSSVR